MAAIWLILLVITGYLIFNHTPKFLGLHWNINSKNTYLTSFVVPDSEAFSYLGVKYFFDPSEKIFPFNHRSLRRSFLRLNQNVLELIYELA
tara:strand:+ start:304 stop:576 length:273 start_codon:yes stop_codon:yes gene_type:complete